MSSTPDRPLDAGPREMLTFPRVPPPALCVYESHTEFAERIGAAAHGVESLTASYLVVQNDHVGTTATPQAHRAESRRGSTRSARVLLLRRRGCSTSATPRRATDPAPRCRRARRHRVHGVKEKDIVLIRTGAGAYNTEERYRTDHPG